MSEEQIRVRIIESYNGWYWNSGNGVTINKENREGILVNPGNKYVDMALDHGILEIVTTKELKRVIAAAPKDPEPAPAKEAKPAKEEPKVKESIITDTPDTSKAIKEVVTPENNKKLEKIKEEATDGSDSQEPSSERSHV